MSLNQLSNRNFRRGRNTSHDMLGKWSGKKASSNEQQLIENINQVEVYTRPSYRIGWIKLHFNVSCESRGFCFIENDNKFVKFF